MWAGWRRACLRKPARGWWQPFERAVAGDVLVPAGFGPQPPPHLRGAQLVGQRIRVYWRKDDEFYSGTVVAYDATRDDALCYQVRYDVDGELLWDALWDEERNAGFLLEGEGGDHAWLDEGQGGSWVAHGSRMRKRSRWVSAPRGYERGVARGRTNEV